MKAVKLILVGLLLFIAVTLSGDLFQDYLRHFEVAFDFTSFNLPFKVNSEKMTSELLSAAKNYDIRFFTVKHQTDGISIENVCIYYSDVSVLEDIRRTAEVEPREYFSLFFGKTKVSTRPFEESVDEFLTGDYYLLGERTALHNFKMSLMEKYGGTNVHDGYMPKDDDRFAALIWLGVVVVFLLLTFFEYSVHQKENAILLSMGKSPWHLIRKHLAIDAVSIMMIYICSRATLPYITNPAFYQEYHFISLFAMLLCDIFVYFRLFFVKAKHVFKGNKQQTSLLSSCYIAKYLIACCSMILIAINISVAVEAISYHSQGKYWDNYRDYHQFYARYVRDDGDFTLADQQNLKENYGAYSAFFKEANVTLMSRIAGASYFGRELLVYNQNSKQYLQEKLKSIDFDVLIEGNVYAFLPSMYYKNKPRSIDQKELVNMANYTIDWDGNFKDGAEIIYYDDNAKLIALSSDRDFVSKVYDNPIIFFVHMNDFLYPLHVTGDANIGDNIKFTMYDLSPEKFQRFFEERCPEGFSVQLFQANIGDQYDYHWGILRKSLYINLLLSVLFLALNLLITLVTTRLNLSIHAVELALKKILGYTLFQRHLWMLLGSMTSVFCSIALTAILGYRLSWSSPYYILLGGIAFLLIDITSITFVIQQMEKKHIHKILKGGAL